MREAILSLLREAGSGFISGEEIAARLGVTRTAVWKHIQELRAAGYDIASQSRSGYTLRLAPDRLLASEIKHGLNTSLVGREVFSYECLESTNNEAKKLAAAGAAEGTVVVAEEQTGGKGRLSRHFFSPSGKGIWFSVILRPPFLPQEAPKCTLLAAVAVAKAMAEAGLEPAIKWPNDLLYRNRKLVGILTEMSAEMDGIKYVVIGTGINVNIAREEFPEEIRDTAASLMEMKGEPLARVPFLQSVLREMERLYLDVVQEGFGPVFEAWRRYSVTLGQEVQVIGVKNGEKYLGRAVDIDEDGALLVDTEGGLRRVLAGDVSIRAQN